jgi:arabinofuranosyltransferase
MTPGPKLRWVAGPPGWLAAVILITAQLAVAVYYLTDRSPGTAAAWTGFPLDDAWIHLVYGRAVATSGLPYYNTGAAEAGFTSPAWMLVCALAHWLAALFRADVVTVLKVLGIGAGVAMTLGVHKVTRAAANDRWGPLAAGLLTAFTPALAFSQVAGMEVCLAAALGLWALYALQRQKYLWAGLLLAAAFWARPEMIVLGALVVLFMLAAWRTRVLCDRRTALLKLVLPVVIAGALWSGYCLAVTGRPLPNTFYAKFSDTYPAGFITIVREILWPLPFNGWLAGPVLYVVGAIALLRRRSAVCLLALLFPWCFFLATALSRQMPPGSGAYYYWSRYAVPGIPFLSLALGAGWSWLWSGGAPGEARVPGAQRARSSGLMLVGRGAAVVLLVLSFVAAPARLQVQRGLFAWNCQNINEVQVAIGKWVAANTPPDAGVAVVDAGAIRYFGQRRTIDLGGLNFHVLDERLKTGPTSQGPDLGQLISSPATMRDFMRGQKAEYLIIFQDLFPASPESQRFFQHAFHARSPHYTVAEACQDTMLVLALR